MSRAVWAIFGLATLVIGCAESGTQVGPPATHGGTIYGLPDDTGSMEVVKREAPGQPKSIQVVLYFFDPSRTPMSTPPTAASLKLRAGRGAKPIDLKPADEGSLVTGPIPDPGDLEGELKVTIKGKPVTVALGGR